MNHLSRLALLMAAFIILSFLLGCEDKITVNVPPPSVENSPPKILLSGPEFDPGNPVQAPLPRIWVLASDPDGADDIAAVFFHIKSITLNSLIVRPDSATEECRIIHYADMDTINIMPLLESMVFTNDISLSKFNGVYYHYIDYYNLTPGGISAQSSTFGQQVKECSYGTDYNLYLERFGLYPPALPAARDVHVTRADFSLTDISITVYDQSGATDTAVFPDLEVFFTNSLEEEILP